ncbi:enhanced intracellular survival protein Eis [Paenibacillus sp. JSM ZJ436]|uniref:enhanced intracellular survival protein Eis n=1 Tax=Paenibacillus sp. JSM ZJ436 TaxID=3376190 RepID=UPI0037B43D46
MEMRNLSMDEFEDSISLSEYAFQYTLTKEQKDKKRELFRPEQFWGCFEEGKLQAKLSILPFQIYLHNQKFSMGGIAGVATWPENRRKGHVAKLLKHALQHMRAEGQVISFLHPFSIPFYRKFGWEVFTDTLTYKLQMHQLPPKSSVPGRIVRGAADINLLSSLYEAFAERFNGTLVRTTEWWKHSVLKDQVHTAVYYTEDGEPQGYILYELKDKELVCSEFVFLHEQARSALWTYISNHDARIEEVTLTMVPGDDRLPFMLPDPRIRQERFPYFMARIVDVEAFLSSYPLHHITDEGWTLHISDEAAPWNDGVWIIQSNADTGIIVQKVEEAVKGSSPDQLHLDIGALTALLLGYVKPAELVQAGRLQGDETALQRLEASIPVRPPMLMDFF